MLRPGAEEVAELGGLHDFMKWRDPYLPIVRFQVMSLKPEKRVRKVSILAILMKVLHAYPRAQIEIQHFGCEYTHDFG